MHKYVLAGALYAGIVAAPASFAQSPAQTAPAPAATPAPATAAPATATSPSTPPASRRRNGAEEPKSNETRALSLLTFEERKEHRAKMASFKSVAECKAYIETLWQDIDKRAKEKGVTGPLVGPHADTCDQMKARGQIKSAS
jgi:hypothetical protein